MKKTLSVLMAGLLLVSVHTAVFADGLDETYEQNGSTLHYTDLFENIEGKFYPWPGGYDYENGVGSVAFWYVAMPQEEADVLLDKNDDEWTDDEKQSFRIRQGELMELITVGGGRTLEEIAEQEAGLELSEISYTEVGKAEDVIFYAVTMPGMTEEYLEGIEPVYQEEFKTLQEELLEVLKSGEYFEPVIEGADLIGKTLSFETTDVDGNPVKSEDIFKEHDITMVNIWATWCGNCIRELPELSEMNERLAEKNVAVIGICTDANTELDACKALIEENGVEYLNLLPYEGIEEELELSAFPMSYFVGSDGKILGLPFKGAPMEMSAYEEVIDGLLAGEEPAPAETSVQSANDAGVYRVIVADEEGNLVEGAAVQFCSDSTCTLGKTDGEGIAEFEAEEGAYTIHILKVPEGYQATTEEITTDEVYSDIYVVLKKA